MVVYAIHIAIYGVRDYVCKFTHIHVFSFKFKPTTIRTSLSVFFFLAEVKLKSVINFTSN